MSANFPRNNLAYKINTIIGASLLGLSSPGLAQDDTGAEVEEVVVTGSYIRNSAFAQEANVTTISQDDLFESGTPSMGQYIRDMAVTQNINTITNPNGSQDGTQNSHSSTMNLRGLGENSTLVLADGVRSINNSMSTFFPDIALQRMEIVLDGGSALYGSDAVAGVVNMIPIKEFNGIRARTYYQRDESLDFDEYKASLLWGKSFNNGINYVGAFDGSHRSPLMVYERPDLAEYNYGYSSSGNPGEFRRVIGGTSVVNGVHGGDIVAPNLRDPSCGTFGLSDEETSLRKPKNNPSGIPIGETGCYMTHIYQFPLLTETSEYNLYNNMTWEATDWLQFEFTANHSFIKASEVMTSTLALNANGRNAMFIPADHPANPYGFDVVPYNYRPFAYVNEENWPSHLSSSSGARRIPITHYTQRYKLGTRFDMSETWSGYAYYSKQFMTSARDEKLLHLGKLQQALLGQGGPSGNEYWNPFGSADPRSPYYDSATTHNSRELNDWLHSNDDNVRVSDDEMDIFEVTIAGELFELPKGPLQMATGYQMRDMLDFTGYNPLEMTRQDYNVSVIDTPPSPSTYFNKVHAVFVEFDVPILETLAAQAAVRHEKFTDFGLDATTPKVALRWEVTPELALRMSWGESFLAPTAAQARPFDPNENCNEIFFGVDKLTGGQLTGAAGCSSGNPNLKPETSTMKNIGFTWEPSGGLDGLTLSLDYQTIKYTDRIRTLSNPETADKQFQDMLLATGMSEESYDATPGSASRLAANTWLSTQDNSGARGITRDPADQSVLRVVRQSSNISSVWIDLYDLKVDYRYATADLGTITAGVNLSYFDSYEYEDLFGGIRNALGYQNANSGIVPPLPKLKGNLNLGWFMGNHSASLSAAYQHHVLFDDTVNSLLTGYTADRTIESQVLTNLQYSYTFNNLFGAEVLLSGGIRNVFDQMPQRLPILSGFETRLQQPWGRQFWVSLDVTPRF